MHITATQLEDAADAANLDIEDVRTNYGWTITDVTDLIHKVVQTRDELTAASLYERKS